MAIDIAFMFLLIATAYVTHWVSLSSQRNGFKGEIVIWFVTEWACIIFAIFTAAHIFTVWTASF